MFRTDSGWKIVRSNAATVTLALPMSGPVRAWTHCGPSWLYFEFLVIVGYLQLWSLIFPLLVGGMVIRSYTTLSEDCIY